MILIRILEFKRLTNQQLEIAKSNEEKAIIESEKRQRETELAQQKLSLRERDAEFRKRRKAKGNLEGGDFRVAEKTDDDQRGTRFFDFKPEQGHARSRNHEQGKGQIDG